MKVLTLSHFDYLKGPQIFLKAPESFDDEILKQIPPLMNLYEKGFFMHMVGGIKSANLIFDIPSKYMRGTHELLLISILVTEGEINVNFSHELLRRLVDEFLKINDTYKAFYVNSKDYEGDSGKLKTIKNLFYTFYESFPEENILLRQREAKIFVYGLSNAGKTTIIKSLEKTITKNTIPTTNVEISKILVNNLSILTYDAPGHSKFRELWAPHLNNLDGLVFILDVSDKENFDDAREILHKIAMMPKIKNLPILILFNKIDLETPHVESLMQVLNLNELGDRPLKHFSTSGITNENIIQAFNWLALKLPESFKPSSEIDLGIIFSRWDEDAGLKVIETFPRDAFKDPELIAIRCFSISQFVFGGKAFKKVSFILPFTHLKAKAAIYFDYLPDETIRGGSLPLSLVIFYKEEIPSAIIDSFNNIIFDDLDQIKEHYIDKALVLKELEELHKSILILLSTIKPTVKALRGEELRYRALFKAAGDAILIIDHGTGIIMDANEQAKLLFNRSLDKIIGFHVSQLQLTEDFEKFKLQIFKQRELMNVSPIMSVIRRSEGKNIPVEVNVSEAKMGGKKLLHCILRDITERKLAENKLKEAELRYRTIFEQSPDGVMIIDHETLRAVGFNDVICNLLGYSKKEFGKLKINDYDDSESPSETKSRMIKVLKEGRDDFETKFRTKSGNIKDILVTVKIIELSGRTYFHSICRDITQQKLREKQIADLAKFPSENPNPVMRVNRSKVIYTNRVGQDLFKIQKDMQIPIILQEVLNKAFKEGSIKKIELELDNQIYSLIITPIKEESYANIYGRDITERKRSEQKLRESEHNLGERVKELNCLYGISQLVEKPNVSFNEIIQGTLDLIPPAWQFPEITCARVIYDKKEYKTKNFKKTKWGLKTHVVIDEKPMDIEVYYLEDKAFLKEEVNLINDIGKRLKVIFEQKISELNLNALLDNTHLMIAYLDLSFNFIQVNRAYAEADDREISFFPGKNHFDLYPNPENERLFRGVVESGEPFFTFAKPSQYVEHPEWGTSYWDWSLIPIKDSQGLVVNLVLSLQDVTERELVARKLRESEEKVNRLNETFLGFSDDPVANIQRLVVAVGTLLEADNAFYNRIITTNGKRILRTIAIYKEPPNFKREDDPLGHICTDVINQNKKELVIIKDLDTTKYGKTDPGVQSFNLKQYCGSVVRVDNKPVGSFCVVYTKNREITEIDKNILKILSRSVSIEEQRWQAQKKLKKSEESLLRSQQELSVRNQISNVFLTITDDKVYSEVLSIVLNTLQSKIGYFGYINDDGDLVSPSLTRDVWDKCKMQDKNIIFPRDSWKGKWGESLKQKKTIISKGPFELPKGHVSLKNVLCVPIIHQKKLIGQIVVGDSLNGYNTNERVLLETIANYISPILYLRLEHMQHEKERRDIENRLKISEETYRRIFKESPFYIVLLDMDGKIYDINPSVEKVIGYKKQEVFNQDFRQLSLLPTGFIPTTIENFKSLLKGNIPKPQDVQFYTKNGEIRWGHFQGSLLNIDNKQLIQIIGQDITVRKETEEKIKDSEERYHTLFENAPNAYISVSANTKIKNCNSSTVKLLGYSKEELLNSDFFNLFADVPYVFEKAKTVFRRFLKGEVIHNEELRMKRKNGELVWVNLSIKPIWNDKGEIIETYSIAIDITKRKQAEQKLKESEKKFRNIADSSLIGLCILQDNIVKYANHRIAEMYGYTVKEMLNWKPGEFIKMVHPDDRDLILEQAKKKQEGKQDIINHFQFRGLKKTGETIWVDNYSTTTIFNGKTADLISVIEITERKETERKLHESKQKFKTLFNNINDAVFIIDLNGQFLQTNKTARNRLGYTKEEFLQITTGDIVSSELKSTLSYGIKETIEKGYAYLETVHVTKHGHTIPTEISTRKIEYNGTTAIIGVARDITERKKFENELMSILNSTQSILLYRKFQDAAKEIFNTSKNLIGATAGYVTLLSQDGKRFEKLYVDIGDLSCNVDPNYSMSLDRFQTIIYQTKKAVCINDFSNNNGGRKIPKGHINLENVLLAPLIFKGEIFGVLGFANKPKGFNENDVRIISTYAELASIALYNNKMLESIEESQKQYHEAFNMSEFYKDLVIYDIDDIFNNINSASELISLYRDEPTKQDEMTEILAIIKNQLDRGVKLSSNVKKLSKLDEIEFSLNKIDVVKYIYDSINFTKNLFQNRNINIQVNPKDKSFYVRANSFLSDVFQNLFNNSIKYNDNFNIEIVIRLSSTKKKEKNYLKIEVIDNGIGISDFRKQFIFQRRKDIDRKVRGMGIGLSLVKRIIESYNGQIRVEDRIQNNSSNGTRFVILIPEA